MAQDSPKIAFLDLCLPWFPEYLPVRAKVCTCDRYRGQSQQGKEKGKLMQIERQPRRVEVDIPVTVITVLEAHDASIVDLTEVGAQITGCSVPEGARLQIEYLGQTLFAQCRWAEVDRMGVKFLFPLADGRLYERLQIARAAGFYGDAQSGLALAMAPIHRGRTTLGARTFSRVSAGGFGRRN